MNQQIFVYLSRILTMLLVLPLHEAAHGLVAKWMGDETALYQGRITLNPFKHIDPVGSLLMLFTGFGWAKPVPINPLRMKSYRGGVALTALAGPVSNLLAAIIAALVHCIMLCSNSVLMEYTQYMRLGEFNITSCILLVLQYLVSINVGLALFNLIPLPPLDGFNVLRYFTSEKVDRWFYIHQREISIGFLVVILLLTRIPAQYNFLTIAVNKLTDLIWKAAYLIPQSKWG